MSDIEILLRELIEKVDNLENKFDNLTKKVKTAINSNYGTSVWGDDSTPLPLRTTDEILPMKSIQEIRDEQKR